MPLTLELWGVVDEDRGLTCLLDGGGGGSGDGVDGSSHEERGSKFA